MHKEQEQNHNLTSVSRHLILCHATLLFKRLILPKIRAEHVSN